MPAPRPLYPFSAVIGQDDYKLALLANAVDPAIGGVLAVGERGTAKTTLARAFASILRTGDVADEGEATDRERLEASAPFVELPLGATADRLTGSLDTAKLLAGEGAELSDGLLASADGGVLYVDEVNLLGDHLVDLLLDTAASGRVLIERDGISAERSAQLLLVGTMNPEEGALRPQLLDRFGLAVAITAPADVEQRTEVVRRRIAFDRDPTGFLARFEATDRALCEIVLRARVALHAIDIEPEQATLVAGLCASLGVEGLRADIVLTRTACALAALDDRCSVIDRDIETAARLALAHRAKADGVEAAWLSAAEIDVALAAARGDGQSDDPAEQNPPQHQSRPRTPAGESASGAAAPNVAKSLDRRGSGPLGRSAKATSGERPAVDSRDVSDLDDLDLIATARAAVTRRILRGPEAELAEELGGPGSDISDAAPGAIRAEDLRGRVHAGREANLLLCVVDASSSVLENGRAGALRALLGGLVSDAKRKRDRVGLIVFRGREARLVAPPSRNHAAVLSGLDTIEPGGTTPLAAGIRVAHETAQRELRRNPELRPIVALVTDGHANVGSGGDALVEAREAARALRREGITLVVIGESGSGAPRFARSTGAEFYPFDPPAARDAA